MEVVFVESITFTVCYTNKPLFLTEQKFEKCFAPFVNLWTNADDFDFLTSLRGQREWAKANTPVPRMARAPFGPLSLDQLSTRAEDRSQLQLQQP